MHNLPMLAKGPFRCTALVHPSDAARLGLRRRRPRARSRNGARAIEVAGRGQRRDDAGRGQPAARLGPRPARARACAVAAERPGANLNALLDENLRDPLSGNAVLGGVPVRLEAMAVVAAE